MRGWAIRPTQTGCRPSVDASRRCGNTSRGRPPADFMPSWWSVSVGKSPPMTYVPDITGCPAHHDRRHRGVGTAMWAAPAVTSLGARALANLGTVSPPPVCGNGSPSAFCPQQQLPGVRPSRLVLLLRPDTRKHVVRGLPLFALPPEVGCTSNADCVTVPGTICVFEPATGRCFAVVPGHGVCATSCAGG